MKDRIILLVDNVRSAHNVGSIFRTADGLGVNKIILCGITPYPNTKNDGRLPHEQAKITASIAKTSLGAETYVKFEHSPSTIETVKKIREQHYKVYALEQNQNSLNISEFKPEFPCALIVGNEIEGIKKSVLKLADAILEIPMHGQKESLNVSVAAGIALYALATHAS